MYVLYYSCIDEEIDRLKDRIIELESQNRRLQRKADEPVDSVITVRKGGKVNTISCQDIFGNQTFSNHKRVTGSRQRSIQSSSGYSDSRHSRSSSTRGRRYYDDSLSTGSSRSRTTKGSSTFSQ